MENIRKYIYENRWIAIMAFLMTSALYISFGWYSIWNPDSMCRILYIDDTIWVEQARWGAQLWEQIFRNMYVIPVLSMFFAILFLSIIPIIIIWMFRIKTNLLKILIVVAVIPSLHQASTMSYAYCRDEFTFAYLLAVLAAACMFKAIQTKKIKYDIVGIFCLVLSLSIYQAYLSCALVLLALGFIVYFTSDEKVKDSMNAVIRVGVDLFCSLILYIVSVKLSLVIWKTQMSSYRNMDQSWFSVEAIPTMVKDAYRYFYYYFFTNAMFDNDFRGKKIIHLILVIIFLIIVIWQTQKTHKIGLGKTFLLVADIALIPLFFNVVFLMTTTGVSFMMLPSVQYIYLSCAIMVAVFIQDGNEIAFLKHIKKAIVFGTVFLLVAALYTNVIQILIFVDATRIELAKTESIANNLDYSIQANENYSKDMQLLIIGDYEKGNYPDCWGWENNYMTKLKGTVFDFGQFWDTTPVSATIGWQHVFMNYCGTNYNICYSDEKTQEIMESNEYLDMPVFPKEESMRTFGDVFVVKMSE